MLFTQLPLLTYELKVSLSDRVIAFSPQQSDEAVLQTKPSGILLQSLSCTSLTQGRFLNNMAATGGTKHSAGPVSIADSPYSTGKPSARSSSEIEADPRGCCNKPLDKNVVSIAVDQM